nr:beta-defensin 133 [Meriones unguiculatus]
MKLPVLFILFCFLDLLCTVKSELKDTYFCFLKKGKCRPVCSKVEKKAGFCTKLNANCCVPKHKMKALILEDKSTVSTEINYKQNWATNSSFPAHVVLFTKSHC